MRVCGLFGRGRLFFCATFCVELLLLKAGAIKLSNLAASNICCIVCVTLAYVYEVNDRSLLLLNSSELNLLICDFCDFCR